MAPGEHCREAIRQVTPLPPGKQPGCLAAAVAGFERAVSAPAVEPEGELRGRVDVE